MDEKPDYELIRETFHKLQTDMPNPFMKDLAFVKAVLLAITDLNDRLEELEATVNRDKWDNVAGDL
jgi:hypothetical protein